MIQSNPYSRLGTLIATARHNKGLTQGDLSRILGFGGARGTSVAHYEQGRALPTRQTCEALSALFGIPLDALLLMRWQDKNDQFLQRRVNREFDLPDKEKDAISSSGLSVEDVRQQRMSAAYKDIHGVDLLDILQEEF